MDQKQPSEFYQKCSEWCWNNGVKNERHFFMLKKDGYIPEWFPGNPIDYFKRRREWISAYHFFDGKTRINYGKYEKCQELCQSLGVKNRRHFTELRKKDIIPYWVPSHPEIHFKRTKNKEWKGWREFLGIKRQTARNPYLEESYNKCSERCQIEQICSSYHYRKLISEHKLPLWMPAYPPNYFKQRNKWISWKHFLTGQN